MDGYQRLQEKEVGISTILSQNDKRHQSIFDAYKSTVMAMAAAINAKNPYTYANDHIECIIDAYKSTVKAMAATIDIIDSYPQISIHNQ